MWYLTKRTILAIVVLCCVAARGHATELFPTDLPRRDWVHFNAAGFSEPVCGVVYRLDDPVTNGMALGGLDVGCIDLETSGLLGYSIIFNSHVPRRGPMNLPILGLIASFITEKPGFCRVMSNFKCNSFEN